MKIYLSEKLRKVLFILLLCGCLFPFVNSPMALVAGFLVSLLIGNPFQGITAKTINLALKLAIIGLGFSMNLQEALAVGQQGFSFTFFSIALVLILAYFIGKQLNVGRRLSYLIGMGTAICGGSAIAATAPVINAKEDEVSVSLGVIFFLNALALLIFPYLGHWIHLSQYDFGLWTAIAIHDTSSVVGAGSAYGEKALEVATTVKLARTLWIIPLTFVSAYLFKGNRKKIKIPWFIAFFVLAIVINTYIPQIAEINTYIVYMARKIMLLVLFLIGTGLSIKSIKSVGWQPLLLSVLLWVIIGAGSLLVIVFV